MKVYNRLKFNDDRDAAFAHTQVEKFVQAFIGDDVHSVEIDKNAIRLFNRENGGFRYFDISCNIKTSKEMLAFICGMNQGAK